MDVKDAFRAVVRAMPGGVEGVALRLGKREQTLRNELAGDGSAKLGVADAEEITLMAMQVGNAKALVGLQQLALNCGQMLVALPVLPEGVADDCMERLAVSAREFGVLCTEVATDLADGVISDNELARVEKASGELVASVHALGVALAKRNQAGKPGLVFPRVAQP